MEISFFLSVITIIVLLAIGAFFSAAETALTGASKARLHTQAKEGNKRAALASKLRQKKDRMIGALLLGNNFVNIMASALATAVLIKMFGDAGIVYATVVMTALVLIFAEVLPKTYALHHAEATAVLLAPAVRLAVALFSPLTNTVAWIVRACLKVFGVDISKVKSGSHVELLRGAIDLHHGPEEGTREQRVMLRSILDLFDVSIEDIMIHRKNVAMIDGNQSIKKIVEDVLESPYTRMPMWVEDQDNITGIIHVKMLLKELNDNENDPSKVKIENVVLEPWFVPETTSLFDQLQAFRERKEHFAIVVDEYGSFMGVVTLEDILEEIVGEIDDEQDVTVPGVRRLHDGSFLIDGTVTIRDLDREFNWGLPDEEYSTLAGLILHESQMVPEVGQSFSFHGFRFDIVRRQRNQITKVRVTASEPRPLH